MRKSFVLLLLAVMMVAMPSIARAEVIGLGKIAPLTVAFQENGNYGGTQYDVVGFSAPSSVVWVGTQVNSPTPGAAFRQWYLSFPIWNGSGPIEFDFWAITSGGAWFGTRISWNGEWNFTGLGSGTGAPPNPAAVPEPASMLLFGMGLVGLAALARRRSKQ